MRRSFVLMLILALLLAFPVAAQAQSTVTLESLTIQAWPEYDKPSVLVIYDFNVTSDSALPATVSIRLPRNAELLALAKSSDTAPFLTIPQDQPLTVQGDYQVLTFTITDRVAYHVEYYMPYTRSGNQRNFTITWPGDYATKAINFSLQEPLDAQNIVTNPALPDVGPRLDELVYYTGKFPGQAAGQPFSLEATYEKDTDDLSVSSLPVEPATPLDQDISGQASFTAYLPWFLGGLGLVLVAGALVWYWISSRSDGGALKMRKRHASRDDDGDGDENAQHYCAQCGKRAQGGDRFCRACGARLKRGEA